MNLKKQQLIAISLAFCCAAVMPLQAEARKKENKTNETQPVVSSVPQPRSQKQVLIQNTPTESRRITTPNQSKVQVRTIAAAPQLTAKEAKKAAKEKEKEAYKICFEKIAKHKLEMKLVEAEYTFDNNKILFYFTADGRIDFRQLVKDLAAIFKTRIELRQIGVRDETKILGGIGICGRCLCCHTYLSEFAPVSIKMAKEQNLSLNPTKISGVCGRLMCCLKNEQETYEYLNRKLPGVGDIVTLPDGMKGEVSGVNVLRQLVKVLVDVNDEKEMRECPVEELKFKPKHKKEKGKEKKKDRNSSGEQASSEEAK